PGRPAQLLLGRLDRHPARDLRAPEHQRALARRGLRRLRADARPARGGTPRPLRARVPDGLARRLRARRTLRVHHAATENHARLRAAPLALRPRLEPPLRRRLLRRPRARRGARRARTHIRLAARAHLLRLPARRLEVILPP